MNDAGSAATGYMLLCVCWSIPGLLGLVIGYRFRGRFDRLGWWAFMPEFVKSLIEKVLAYGG